MSNLIFCYGRNSPHLNMTFRIQFFLVLYVLRCGSLKLVNVISSAEIADDCVAKFTSLAVSDPERVRD